MAKDAWCWRYSSRATPPSASMTITVWTARGVRASCTLPRPLNRWTLADVAKARRYSTNRFTVNRMHISYRLHRDYRDVESFKVLVVVSGHIEISDSCGTEKAGPGTLLLVGADQRDVTLKPTDGEAIVIETYI